MVDTDGDGMADLWETTIKGISLVEELERFNDGDGDGYTHLDDYLSDLAEEAP